MQKTPYVTSAYSNTSDNIDRLTFTVKASIVAERLLLFDTGHTFLLQYEVTRMSQENVFGYFGFSVSSKRKHLYDLLTRIAKAAETFDQMKEITKIKTI